MRSIWLIFGGLLLVLFGLKFFMRPAAPASAPSALPAVPTAQLVSERVARTGSLTAQPSAPTPGPRDSLVRFALRQLGTPYVYAGSLPATGFDCSGFITYVFAHFGVATPHATALLIDAGRPVPRAEAQPGDIVVFTGTAEGSTTPGHAGIVISGRGETPLRFVHASSARRESGVKVSQVENSGYERRFLQVRRVLGGTPANAIVTAPRRPAATLPAAPRPAGAVAALPAAVPSAAPEPVPTMPLPARVAPLALPHRPARPVAHVVKTKLSAKHQPTAHTSAAKKPAKTPISPKAAPKKPATTPATHQAMLKKPATRPAVTPGASALRAHHKTTAKPKSR